MRDLIITENITLDGVIDAADGWFMPAGAEAVDQSDVIAALAEQREAADAFLVGRRTFEQMRGFWPQRTDDETGVSDYLARVQKYVVSTTLEDPGWEPTTILRRLDEVRALKQRDGADVVATGSLTLVPRPHRGGARGRVPAVRVPGRPRSRAAALRGFDGAAAPRAGRGAAVQVRDRAAALPGRLAGAAHAQRAGEEASATAPWRADGSTLRAAATTPA